MDTLSPIQVIQVTNKVTLRSVNCDNNAQLSIYDNTKVPSEECINRYKVNGAWNYSYSETRREELLSKRNKERVILKAQGYSKRFNKLVNIIQLAILEKIKDLTPQTAA